MTILSSAYLAPVQYYTKLCGGDVVIEDRGEHYLKQTYRNRCHILGAQGVESLIVPVEHDSGLGASHTPMRDMRISSHDPNWQRHHWQALRTAYEGTPYFEYYTDEFAPLYQKSYTYLCDWNEDLLQASCALLGITPQRQVSDTYVTANEADTDFRQVIRPKNAPTDAHFRPAPYYQIRTAGKTFVPNLSIIDLLCHMGPEARIVLHDSQV